jgi:homoserine dehydrogenase
LEAKKSALPSISETIEYLAGAPDKVILVDNTSSGAIAEAYPEFLRRGISIITPNKKAFSGNYNLWQDIFDAAQLGGSMVYHESSVGAGMPIISTLKELVQTGDEVTRIEGVFSGTMSFLFNRFSPTSGPGGKWSETVKKAKEFGYTEPDPRDDLNGLDVARKLTILGRLAGLPIESPASFPVQNLIPRELQSCENSEEFISRLHEFDYRMESQRALAERAGKVLRYVGSIEMGTKNVKVGMEMFDHMHPIATLKGSDNIISFYTKRYGEAPLTIRGAGAGGDVTAMGVIGDLLKVLSQMS